jgi:hypothetical protein
MGFAGENRKLGHEHYRVPRASMRQMIMKASPSENSLGLYEYNDSRHVFVRGESFEVSRPLYSSGGNKRLRFVAEGWSGCRDEIEGKANRY